MQKNMKHISVDIKEYMSGGFYLLCGPSKEDWPHLVLISFFRFRHCSIMSGLVFQFWKVGHEQALLLLYIVFMKTL